MGKYIKKSKVDAGVAAVDMTLGVRTRAKSLALERPRYHLRSRSHLRSPKNAQSNKCGTIGNSCPNPNRYFQAPQTLMISGRVSRTVERNYVTSEKVVGLAAVSVESPVLRPSKDGNRVVRTNESEINEAVVEASNGDGAIDSIAEPSLRDNMVDMDSLQRTVRESTPCSSTRDTHSTQTPCSSTELSQTAEAFQRRNKQRCVPSSLEMNNFFEGAEKEQIRDFIQKYNFDPVNEKPLPGRYEWVQLSPPDN